MKKKKVLDIVGMVIISAIIGVLNLIVGANEKGLRILPMGVMLFFAVMYLIIRKILLKQKILIKNGVDVCVLLFMCCTLLPLVFGTYCTRQGTVEFILKYFFVYTLFLLVRNTVDGKKKVNLLIFVTLVSSLMIAIIGIDVQHRQYLNWLLEKLNLKYTYSHALVSSFGYANSVAVYFSFCILLAIHQIQNADKKWMKLFCSVYLILGFYIVFQTLSRSIFVLLLGTIFGYFILYYATKILRHKKEAGMILGAGIVLVVIFFGFVFGVGVKVSKPYELTGEKYQRNFNYDFKANQEYTIELELAIGNSSENSETYIEVEILEINPYFNEQILAARMVKPSEKKIALKFMTTNQLYQIDMLVINRSKVKAFIEKCYINGKEYPMNYKFLPYQIGEAITMYSANDKSIKQRMDFWKDCLKIAKDAPIIGQGGDTWKKLSQTVQEYPYSMKETHSYFFELLISYGIVGVLLYVVLIVFLNVKIIKECIESEESRSYKLSILLGLDLVILHSFCFDFDLSFLCVLATVFAYMGVLLYDSKQTIQRSGKLDYVGLFFLSGLVIVYIMANMAQYVLKNKKLKKDFCFYNFYFQYEYIAEGIINNRDFRENLKALQDLIKEEPYFYQSEMYNSYWNVLIDGLGELEEAEVTQYVSFMNERYRNVKFATPMYIETVLPRAYIMKNAYTLLKQMDYRDENLLKQIEELNQIMKSEYEVNIKNIKDKERNGYNQGYIEMIIQEYEKILNE